MVKSRLLFSAVFDRSYLTLRSQSVPQLCVRQVVSLIWVSHDR